MGLFNIRICAVGLLVLAGMLLPSCAIRADTQYKELNIQFAADMKPELAKVIVKQIGPEERYDTFQACGESKVITVRVSADVTSAKILIQYPGYKLVAMEVPGKDISSDKPITPEFEKLPTVLLKAKFIYSDGKPIANKQVTISQNLLGQAYFNPKHAECIILRGSDFDEKPVATGYTDDSGILSLEVPQLLDDPILIEYHVNKLVYYVKMDVDKLNGFTADFVPPSIPAQRSYPDLIDIKAVYQGRISGKIEKSFLDRNGITAPLGDERGSIMAYIFDPLLHNGYGISAKADGSFTRELPAGKYSVSVEYQNPGKDSERKTIPAGIEVVLGEAEEKNIVIK